MANESTDVAIPIAEHLRQHHWDIYPEAQFRTRGPRADIVAYKNPLLWVIETKSSMNLQVLEQAMRWRDSGALLVSIGIPKPKRKSSQKFVWHSQMVDRICRQEGFGLIFVCSKTHFVKEVISPRLYRFNYERSRYLITNLDHKMQSQTPGSSAAGGYSTPHQRTLQYALAYLREHSPCSISTLLDNIKTHFHVRSKARKYLIQHLCDHPDIDYVYQGYDVIFTLSLEASLVK